MHSEAELIASIREHALTGLLQTTTLREHEDLQWALRVYFIAVMSAIDDLANIVAKQGKDTDQEQDPISPPAQQLPSAKIRAADRWGTPDADGEELT